MRIINGRIVSQTVTVPSIPKAAARIPRETAAACGRGTRRSAAWKRWVSGREDRMRRREGVIVSPTVLQIMRTSAAWKYYASGGRYEGKEDGRCIMWKLRV